MEEFAKYEVQKKQIQEYLVRCRGIKLYRGITVAQYQNLSTRKPRFFEAIDILKRRILNGE